MRECRRPFDQSAHPAMVNLEEPNQEVLAALHEAGHAVMYDYAGYRITFLDLRYSKGGLGAKTGHERIEGHRFATMDDDSLRRHLAAVVGGMQAEHIFLTVAYPDNPDRTSVRQMGGDDAGHLGGIETVCGRPNERFTELLREAEWLAVNVLRERWRAVEAVAYAALDADGQRLAGWKVRKIIKRAMKEKAGE